jgi:chloramphenicol-sensitive protein RarD
MHPGIAYATTAYVVWGLFPLYFRELAHVPATEVLVHRIVWSLAFVLAVLTARRQWAWLPAVLRQPKVLGAFALSALLLSTNWLTYIWSVANGHVLDSSLGYFITPLVNVLLGYTVLHERPRTPQWAALALAAAGVLWLTIQAGQLPWIALLLAATFGSYGLMRKVAPLGAIEGLTLETMLLSPAAIIALAWWLGHGTGAFPAPDAKTNLLLLGIGPLTAIPLLMFAAGARRISMTTLGLLQYLGPTIQFLLGVWLFQEPFDTHRGIGFAFIWAGLAAYTWDGWRTARLRAATAPAPA